MRLEDKLDLKYGIPFKGYIDFIRENTSNDNATRQALSLLGTYHLMNAAIMFYVTYSLVESFLK